MKKIVNIITQKTSGGSQVLEARIRPFFMEKFETKTVYLYLKSDLNDGDGSICLLKKKPKVFHYPLIFAKLVIFLLKYKPDLVLCWGGTSNSFGILASLFVGRKVKRVVIQSCSLFAYGYRKGKLEKMIGYIGSFLDLLLGSIGIYDLNIMVSEYCLASYNKFPRKYLKRCKVIVNGVYIDKSKTELNQNNEILNFIFDKYKGKRIVGAVGSLIGIKNYELVIRSLEYLPNDICFVLIGYGSLKKHLTEIVKNLSLEDRVSIIDFIDNDYIPSFLKRLDVFVHPSLDESFGLSVMEAAIVGLPILTIKAEWVYSNLLPDFHGASDNNPKDFAEMIYKSLYDEKFRNLLISDSTKIAEKYSFQSMVDNYIKEIEYLLNK